MKKVLFLIMCIICTFVLSSCGSRFDEAQVLDYIISITGKGEEDILQEDLDAVTDLYLYNAQSISDISKFKNLSMLSVTDSDVENWKAIYKTKLKSLELWNNIGETDFSLIDKSVLTSLSVKGDDVINLESLAEAENLTSLIIWSAPDTDFSFIKELENLEYLEIVDCSIEDISFVENLENLTGLVLSENRIEDLSALRAHMGIQLLDLRHNRISDISALENIIDMQELNLSENAIEDISPIGNLTGIVNINLSNNNIKDISPLSRLRFLQAADISSNRIESLSGLENISSLFEINAHDNIIEYVPAKLFKNIYYMDLSANNLRMDNASLLVWLEQNNHSFGGINLFDNFFSERDINALAQIDSVAFLSNGLPVSAQGYVEYNSTLDALLNALQGLGEREKALGIYTYLASNCVHSETESLENSLGSFNVIVNKKGTSIDCANALSSAFRRVGIESSVYCGDRFGNSQTDMKHYWNIAVIDDTTVYCDLYCDLGFLSSPAYFGINDYDMSENEHIMLDDYRGAVVGRLD